MLTQDEKSRLANFRGMGTMNQAQALEYHELLDKEYAADMEPVSVVEPVVEAPKKRGGKKK